MFSKLFGRKEAQLPTADTPHSPANLEHFAWLLGREPAAGDLDMHLVQSAGESVDDLDLVRRVMAAYVSSVRQFSPSGSGWDKEIFELNKDLHQSLTGNDPQSAAHLLRNPADTTHFWGFDAIAKAPAGAVEPHELVITRLNSSVRWQSLYALWIFDAIKNLADAVGAKRVAYPEIDVRSSPIEQRQNVEEVLSSIELVIGVRLTFPNPYRGEWGIPTSKGVIGFRSVQAVYQAWRIRELSRGAADYRVLEIGAGLGRTAYFAALMGISRYTLVDIPLTGAAQGYFLGRTLGAARIGLHDEPNTGSIRVRGPSSEALQEEYDLVVNVDSLPELAPEVSSSYWTFIKSNAHQFLSINHEFNPVTVRSLYVSDPSLFATRHPYWMRRGYVEELITIRS
jgi:hypothetical protein